MLKGSVRVPQCRGAYSSEPAAMKRAYTHTHTYTKHLDALMHAYVAHNEALFVDFCALIDTEMGMNLSREPSPIHAHIYKAFFYCH